MKKKQNSIDWLVEQLEAQGFLYDLDIEQAKAMHKEEIQDAYDDGWHHNNEDKYNPIKYYTKTFGGQGNE